MAVKHAFKHLVLIRPGWPNGFCPVHVATGFGCTNWCVPNRIKFKAAAASLDQYWASQARKAALH
jgi:hypothetical protein